MPSGLEVQARLDALTQDLSAQAQTRGVGLTVEIPIRSQTNAIQTYTISATADGQIDVDAVEQLQVEVVNPMKTSSDAFNAAKASYDLSNVPENYGALGNAKGEYRLT